ncbi:MAG: ABC transporter permease [Tissierellales bacterium]|nr:ABC transporter permease [Tissierellales bacterium]MBN2826814.1 ABC transporter permease [Tissierellales bacterium]
MKGEKLIKKIWNSMKFPLIAIVLGFLVGAIFIIASDNSPIVAYQALFQGSLSSFSSFGETLYKTTPILFTGLAIAVAFRTGLFNIGAEGQYIVGAISAVAAGWYFQGLPHLPLIIAIVISGALAGALWASIAGFLKAKIGVHEVITTIMLNYTALHLSNYIAKAVLNPQVLEGTEKKAHTVSLTDAGKLTKLNEIIPQFEYSSAHTGIFIALAMVFVIYILLFKTSIGYELRSVGKNPDAAEYGGINKTKNIIISMAISGSLAGMAGAVQVAGLLYKVSQTPNMPGYGFDGIAVALVGQNHPIGIIFSALLFGILSNGSRKMQIAGIPKEIIGIIQGVIIVFVAADQMSKILEKRKKAKIKPKEGDEK